jgi:DNA (cytosine-5)-methyltransferase 1
MTLTVGSCFAGIGGIDLGLEAAGGFRTIWHSEIKPAACRVMADRFPESEPLGDITALTEGMFPPPPADVIVGGPPCQGISKGNAWGRAGLADPRSGLFHTYAELIDIVRPEWVVMEQVTGLLSSGPTPGDDYATVLNTYKELGYAIDIAVVNSLAYVPQTRERLIIVGHREQEAATRALLPLKQDGACHPDEGRPTRRRAATRVGTGAHIYRKSRRPAHDQDGETWVEADYANTLTLNDVGVSRATVVVLDDLGRPRVLTPEEWEGCHGFPRGWTAAAGGDVDRWQALGNTVSPPMAQRIGTGINEVAA